MGKLRHGLGEASQGHDQGYYREMELQGQGGWGLGGEFRNPGSLSVSALTLSLHSAVYSYQPLPPLGGTRARLRQSAAGITGHSSLSHSPLWPLRTHLPPWVDLLVTACHAPWDNKSVHRKIVTSSCMQWTKGEGLWGHRLQWIPEREPHTEGKAGCLSGDSYWCPGTPAPAVSMETPVTQ